MNETKLVNYPLFKGMSKEEHDAFLQRNFGIDESYYEFDYCISL